MISHRAHPAFAGGFRIAARLAAQVAAQLSPFPTRDDPLALLGTRGNLRMLSIGDQFSRKSNVFFLHPLTPNLSNLVKIEKLEFLHTSRTCGEIIPSRFGRTISYIWFKILI